MAILAMYISPLAILEYHHQQLTIGKETGETAVEANAFGNLGTSYCQLRDFKKAIEYHQQHLSIAEDIEDLAAEGTAYSNFGLTHYSPDDLCKAEFFKSSVRVDLR